MDLRLLDAQPSAAERDAVDAVVGAPVPADGRAERRGHASRARRHLPPRAARRAASRRLDQPRGARVRVRASRRPAHRTRTGSACFYGPSRSRNGPRVSSTSATTSRAPPGRRSRSRTSTSSRARASARGERAPAALPVVGRRRDAARGRTRRRTAPRPRPRRLRRRATRPSACSAASASSMRRASTTTGPTAAARRSRGRKRSARRASAASWPRRSCSGGAEPRSPGPP